MTSFSAIAQKTRKARIVPGSCLLGVLALFCVTNTNEARAQQQQQQQAQTQSAPPSPNGGQPAQADDSAPESGLGKDVGTAKVVYPSASAITDDTLNMLDQLQLTPEQAARLKQLRIDKERLKATPYVSPPEPVTRTLAVSLDPGITPPVLRLTQGQQSSIVFSDMSGNPWIIEKISVNCDFFIIDQCGQKGASAAPVQANTQGGNTATQGPKPTNVLTIEANTPAAYGNVTVTLRGLSTPVIFVLTSAQKEVDMRVDAKIPGHNPDAQDDITFNAMPTEDAELSSFLDDVPPAGAQRLTVTGLDGTEAWSYQNALYVRARGDVQYPAYKNAARSTSGVTVYKFVEMHNSVTLLTGGQAVTVFIQ
jgi:intracellular multiplication protein IcmK